VDFETHGKHIVAKTCWVWSWVMSGCTV